MATTALTRRPTVIEYMPDVNKNYVWGAVLIVAGLVGIYYWGRNNATVEQAPLPNDTLPKTDPVTGQTTNPLTDAESKDIIRIANELKTQMGYIIDPDISLLDDLFGSSDRVFVGVYNYYNTLYSTAPDTLKTIISGYTSWQIWFGEINRKYDAIVARMDKLGLK
ncbi:MAG: hypothetical protein WCK09_15355 [Bacteroidota bacterium]